MYPLEVRHFNVASLIISGIIPDRESLGWVWKVQSLSEKFLNSLSKQVPPLDGIYLMDGLEIMKKSNKNLRTKKQQALIHSSIKTVTGKSVTGGLELLETRMLMSHPGGVTHGAIHWMALPTVAKTISTTTSHPRFVLPSSRAASPKFSSTGQGFTPAQIG